MLDPYKHKHLLVEEIPWSRLGKLLIELAETIRKDWWPDIVVGIAKGGVIPAVYLSSLFQLDFYPIKLSSRSKEKIIHELPVWHVYPTSHVEGKKVLLVDDICVAGRTLKMATSELKKQGASEVRSATLAVHEESVSPNYWVLKTDALIVWPWDRDVLSEDGIWSINSEYLEEMREVSQYIPGPSPAIEPEGNWIK